jgi:hypothetical protein
MDITAKVEIGSSMGSVDLREGPMVAAQQDAISEAMHVILLPAYGEGLHKEKALTSPIRFLKIT